tara:strand:+ start:1614 stop:2051 length:438 start_codon:yes stop_codon:yes gene_type:complete
MKFQSTKIIELGSACFRQPMAQSHCQYLHGYNLKAKFWFEAENLNESNWVVDFGGFKDIKQTLRNTFDHKTVVCKDDPKLRLFRAMDEEDIIDLVILDKVGCEFFSLYCFHKMNLWLKSKNYKNNPVCIKVEVYEHSKNSAITSQ